MSEKPVKQRRTWTNAEKLEVVAMCQTKGRMEVSRTMGIDKSCLTRWIASQSLLRQHAETAPSGIRLPPGVCIRRGKMPWRDLPPNALMLNASPIPTPTKNLTEMKMLNLIKSPPPMTALAMKKRIDLGDKVWSVLADPWGDKDQEGIPEHLKLIDIANIYEPPPYLVQNEFGTALRTGIIPERLVIRLAPPVAHVLMPPVLDDDETEASDESAADAEGDEDKDEGVEKLASDEEMPSLNDVDIEENFWGRNV